MFAATSSRPVTAISKCSVMLKAQLCFLRHVAARTMRVMRLDAPVFIDKKLMRNGVEIQIPTLVRQRQFAQMLGATWIYFREFGSPSYMNFETG